MQNKNFGFKTPIDSKIAGIFQKQKELQSQNQTIESQKTLDIPVVNIPEEEPKTNQLQAGYIGMTGIVIRDNGQITKEDHMAKLAIDANKYKNITLSEEEAKKVIYQMKRMTTGVNAVVPLVCTGDLCPFKRSCVYYEIGKVPLGKPCLVETQLIEYWMAQYFEEFEVNPTRITEVHLISELAELDIYEMRVTKYLAENHQTLLQEVMSGVDPAGNIISNLEVSRAFDLKERLKRQRMKVLEALMATRKEKIKAITGVTGGTDAASRISELKEKLEKLNRDVSAVTIDGEAVRV